MVSDGALLRARQLRSIELPIALLDAASPLVAGNDDAYMVGRAALQAAAISCCVLPFANARTCSPRVDAVRLPLAGFVAVVRGRPLDRAEAAVVAMVGVLTEAVFFAGVPLL